ncbi:hypothetical protein [Streptomyces sp. NPDC047453]|uniref:hypothetical protein n=1 Tax=Streptomyces sp. NPDC047453 TaxID=3154812 RepID=UPI0033CD01B3
MRFGYAPHLSRHDLHRKSLIRSRGRRRPIAHVVGSLLNGVVLLIEHGTRLLQGAVYVVESGVVRDRLQTGMGNLRGYVLCEVLILISHPFAQRSEFGFQALNAAGRMVGDLLGGIPLLLGTSQLLVQVGLLPLRAGSRPTGPAGRSWTGWSATTFRRSTWQSRTCDSTAHLQHQDRRVAARAVSPRSRDPGN